MAEIVGGLTQFGRFVKQAGELVERVAVGHPGEEVGHPTISPPLVSARLELPWRRHCRRIGDVALEQSHDDPLSLCHHIEDARMAINAFSKERLDVGIGRRHLGGESNHRRGS